MSKRISHNQLKKWKILFFLFLMIGMTPLFGATITWTNGGGDNLWSNTNNWSSTASPTTSDNVVFDGTSVADAILDIATGIKSVTIDAAYTGQVSLGSQTLTIQGNLTVDNSSQLDAGTGTVAFISTGTVNCPADLYNISITTGYSQKTTLSQNLTVSNDVLITSMNSMSGDTLKVHGDIVCNGSANHANYIKLVGSTDQTISGTGSLEYVSIEKTGGDVLMPSDFTFQTGQLRGSGYINTTGQLNILSSYVFDFSGTIDDINFNGGYSTSVSLSQNLTINDSLTLTAVNNMGGDTLKVHGDIVSNTGANHSSYIKLVGSTDQTISGTGSLEYVSIEKTGGDVLMPSDFTFSDGQLRGTGYINTTGHLTFQNNYAFNFSGTIDDVEFTSTYGKSMSLGENLTINDSLIITGLYISGDTIKVHGDVISNSSTNSASRIKLVGSADQTISGTGSIRNFFLNKPSGNLLFDASYGKVFTTFRVEGYEWDVNNETITASNFYIADGATIKGEGTLTGNLIAEDGGIINPGSSPGCLAITGNLNLQAGSHYIAEIGGTTACTDYDQLQVGGTVTVAGDLEVVLLNGFTPNSSQSFDIINSTNQSGTFANVTPPVDFNATPVYNSSGIVLGVVSTAVAMEIGTDSACIGENVIIPVNIGNGNGVGSFSIQIDFDNTALELVQNTNQHTGLGNGNFQITDVATANTNGYITMSWFDGANINGTSFGDSKLLDLEFKTLTTGASNLTWNTTGSNGDITDGLGNALGLILTDSIAYAYDLPTPTIMANDTSVCLGEMVTFTATGGVAYEFFVNGVSQGTASTTSTFMTNTLVDGDEIDVYVTNMNGCTDSSSVITMIIFDLPIPGIASSDSDDVICIGDAVTFTAIGGVSYEFLINGTTVQAASATDTYTTTMLADGDAVSVIVTNANGCIDTSNAIMMMVNPLPVAGITSSDADNTICIGDAVTFTGTGGVSYEFLLNGTTIQAASGTDTYTTTTLADGDAVNVIVTNANGCIDTSSAIMTTVNPLPTAGITSSDADNAICLNESVTFMGTGGVSYEFLLNGVTAQAASAADTYTTTTLADGDSVSVIVTNANGCISTSSAITTTVRPLPVAQNVTGGGDFCPNNGGTVIGLDGSEMGVSYQLVFNGSVVETITGTGSAIDFTGVMTTSTTGDVYTVSAFNTTNTDCVFDMNGSATVTLTCFDVTVDLIYDNGQNQGLKNTPVVLYDKTGVTAGTGTTDNNGQVTFTNVNNGTGYYIDADLSGKQHGGINATDALLVALDFANHITLAGMKERASDVDGNGSNNANDALQISKRYVGNTYTFVADWLHDNDNTNAFDVNGMDMTMTSLVLAYGDVNGSYDVSGLNNGNKSIISLYQEGEIIAEENATVSIPFYTKERIETGAISMVMNYPYDVFDIENITVGNNATNVLYEIVDGRIRLSWFNIQPIAINTNEALFTITAKIRNNLANAYTPTITFGNETELADGTGNVIEQVSLASPTITLPNQTVLGRSMNFKQMIYPNPATVQTTLEYNLPTDARVTIELYDAVGRRISILENTNQTQGLYTLPIDTQALNSGLYKIRTIISTENSTDIYTKQLMIAK